MLTAVRVAVVMAFALGLNGVSYTVSAASASDAACADGEACLNEGNQFCEGTGVAQDYVRCRASYARGCELKHAECCSLLGSLLLTGEGGLQDKAQAYASFERACALGSEDDCLQTGRYYLHGEDEKHTGSNPAKGIAVLTSSCAKDNAKACASAGVFCQGRFYQGEKVGGCDVRQALQMLNKACELGNLTGCQNLAIFYHRGIYRKTDFVRAAELYTRACNEGKMAISCHNLGMMYLHALGMRQQVRQAVAYLQQACDLGIKNSCLAAQQLERERRSGADLRHYVGGGTDWEDASVD